MAECYSCGAEANPDSPREFCNDCDAHFEAGLAIQKKSAERSEKLEAAKASGDTDTVAKLVSEIALEAYAADSNTVNSGPAITEAGS